MNVAFPVEDQKCSLRRNFERTMQAAASTKDPERSRRLETAAVDILCQTDDRTKAALTAQGLCTNPSLTTADHRFENPTPNVAQVAPPAQAQYALAGARRAIYGERARRAGIPGVVRAEHHGQFAAAA